MAVGDEKYYTVKEIAEMWRASESFVLRLFRDEPGVLRLGNVNLRRRTRIPIRIPQSVLDRVSQQQTVPAIRKKTA